MTLTTVARNKDIIKHCMKTTNWKTLVASASVFLLLAVGVIYLLTTDRAPDLAEAICQPSDLGEYHHVSDRPPGLTNPHLGETVVASYTVTLVDLQVSYTMLDCSIIRYVDETAAHRAFDRVCENQTEQTKLEVGNEACVFEGNAPTNLAFRRNEFLVLMSGDLGDIGSFPASAVDVRLK